MLKSAQISDAKIMIGLAILVILVFLPFLGSCGIIDPSDGFYAEAAREMVERGDFLTPYLNYEPWFDKPILTYWLIITAYKIFGISTFASRFSSALCAMLLILFIYKVGRLFVNRRTALTCALLLASTPLYVVIGHLALTDMPLTLCTAVSSLSLFAVLRGKSNWYLVLGYLALGLAVLGKGPVGVIFVVMSLAAYAIACDPKPKPVWQAFCKLKPWYGLLVVAAVALPWYVYEHLATAGAFSRHFFIEQNYGRAVGSVDHLHPFWYYIPYVAGGFFPWTAFLPLVFILIASLRKRLTHLNDRDALLLFSFIWAFAALALLSAVPTKLPTYILPVMPALAICTAISLDSFVRLSKNRLFLIGALLVLLAACGSLFIVPKMLTYAPGLTPLMLGGIALTVLGIVASFVLVLRDKSSQALKGIVLSTTVGCAVLVPLGLNAFWAHHQAGFRILIQRALDARANLAIFGNIHAPSAPFYMQRRVLFITNQEELANFLADDKKPHWLLLGDNRMKDFLKLEHGYNQIENQRKWNLLSLD